jgi:DNA-binding NarL/FixJ family response regulator
MAEIVALVNDLFFQTKIAETAKQLGVGLCTCSTAEALLSEIENDPPKLVVVDLQGPNDPIGAIARLKARGSNIPLIGFLSHGEVDLAERARAAGCSEVMPRSKFTRDLATILGGAKSES